MTNNPKQSILLQVLLTVPAILSMVLLAAHFYRAGNSAPAILCLHGPILVFRNKAYLIRIMQGALIFAALIWVNTILTIYQARVAMDQQWGGTVIILLAVIALSLISIWLLEIRLIRVKDSKNESLD